MVSKSSPSENVDQQQFVTTGKKLGCYTCRSGRTEGGWGQDLSDLTMKLVEENMLFYHCALWSVWCVWKPQIWAWQTTANRNPLETTKHTPPSMIRVMSAVWNMEVVPVRGRCWGGRHFIWGYLLIKKTYFQAYNFLQDKQKEIRQT